MSFTETLQSITGKLLADCTDQELYLALLEIVRSEDFRTILQGQTGYDVTCTGELFSL